MPRIAAVLCLGCALLAQDAYQIAPSHYKLELDNEWVRIGRVTYGPHEIAAMQDHPAVPTVYVYTRDGGQMVFKHDQIGTIRRPGVKTGQLRYVGAHKESHDVEYLGDIATEYLRIELKTQPLGLSTGEFRSSPEPHPTTSNFSKTDFENGQVRIVRVYCAPNQSCVPGDDTNHPAVLVSLAMRQFQWLAAGPKPPIQKPGDYVYLELKSKP